MMLIIRVITIWPPHHGDSLEETCSVNAIQAIHHYPLPQNTIMMMITRRKLIFTKNNRQVNKAYFLLEFLRKDAVLGVRAKYADASSSTGRAEWKRQFMSGKMRADTQKSARIGANLSIVSLQISPEPGSHLHQFGFFLAGSSFPAKVIQYVFNFQKTQKPRILKEKLIRWLETLWSLGRLRCLESGLDTPPRSPSLAI